MALTIIERPQAAAQIRQYPCLGKYENGMIVLFTSMDTGTILVSSPGYGSKVGHYSTHFCNDWVIYEGKVEIEYQHD